MAVYLVKAKINKLKLNELEKNLKDKKYYPLPSFGGEVSDALTRAKISGERTAMWEEIDFCTPPLRQEKDAVLDEFFTGITVEIVSSGEGWKKLEGLPFLFPELN